MKDITVIFPAYNEIDRIQPTLESYYRVLEKMELKYEILVVDDGSSDGTADFVEKLQDEIPHLSVIRCPKNQGKGAAVRIGMLKAKGAIRVMTDADGSVSASQLNSLYQSITDEEVDVSIGSRYVKGAVIENPQPLHRRLWSRFANVFIQKMLLPGIVDTQCGFKAFTAKAAIDIFSDAATNGWSFDLEALAFAQLKGYKIAEIPVSWSDDDRSKGHFEQLPKTIRELFRIRKRIAVAEQEFNDLQCYHSQIQ